MRKKRLLLILGIPLTLVTGLYLARRWVFESTVIDQIQAALRPALGDDIRIGAVQGNWLSTLVLQGLEIRGDKDSGLESVTGGEIDLEYSLWSLMQGDTRGLHRARVRFAHVALNLAKPLTKPRPAEPPEGAPVPLAVWLATLSGGLELDIDRLELASQDRGADPFKLRISPGTGRRKIEIEFGTTKCSAFLDPDGSYQAEVSSEVAGFILRTLGLKNVTQPAGSLALSLTGRTDPVEIDFKAKATAVLTQGKVNVECDLAWRDGRLRSNSIVIKVPGLQVLGRKLDLPLAELTDQSLQEFVQESAAGSLSLEITNLEPYRAQLPKLVLDLLPITGRLALEVAGGTVHLRESTFTSPGLDLRLKAGSFSLLDLPFQEFSVARLRETSAKDIAFELDLKKPLRIAAGNEAVLVSGSLQGTLGGSVAKPAMQTDVALRNLIFQNFRCQKLDASLTFDGRQLTAKNLRVEGAGRTEDDFALGFEGSANLLLEPAMQLSASIRGKLPSAVLHLAKLDPESLDGLAETPYSLTADIRFPTADKPITGSIDLRASSIQYRKLRPLSLHSKVTFTGEVVEVNELVLEGEQAKLRATGRVSIPGKHIELKASGLIRHLKPFTETAQLHALAGQLHIDELTISGPFDGPHVSVGCRLKLSEIAPAWLPEDHREHLPTAPLDLNLRATSAPDGIEVQELKLAWGGAETRRIELRADGPVPLRWSEEKSKGQFEVRQTSAPLVCDVTIHAHDAIPGQPSVDLTAKVKILADRIEIPQLTVTAADGRILGEAISLNLGVREMLDGTISPRTLPIRGSLVVENFKFQGLLSRMLAGVEVTGLVHGKLVASGNWQTPRVVGHLQLDGGTMTYPDTPTLRNLLVRANFSQDRVAVSCTATADQSPPLHIDAWLGSDRAPVWDYFLRDNAPLLGGLKVRGLNLSMIPRKLLKFGQTQCLSVAGVITIDGTLAGNWQDPQPTLEIAIVDATLRAPGVAEIREFEFRTRIEASRLVISRCKAKVLDTPLEIEADLSIGGTTLWKLRDQPTSSLHGFVKIIDFPLPVIPSKLSPWQDLEGVLRGRLDLAGTIAAPEPKLTLKLLGAAAKFATLPRISDIESTLTATQKKCQLILSGSMGAEPLQARVELVAGEGTFVESWRKAILDATVKGQRLLLMRRGGLKLRGSVDLIAKGPLDEIEIGGEIALDKGSKLIKRLSLVPDLKTRGGGGGSTFGPWSLPGGERLNIDIRLITKAPLLVRTGVFDSDLQLACRIVGQGDGFHLAGVCSGEGGTLRFPGMSMRLHNLQLMFREANPSRPTILATASGQRHGVRINLRVKDYWDAPVITLASSPALPPKELWTFVTTGKRPDSLAEGTTQSNTALIATYVLQELLLTYLASESTEVKDSFVSRFTFEFGTEISRGGQETWKVDLDVGGLWVMPKNFGVQVERDVYEDINLGLVYRWRF